MQRAAGVADPMDARLMVEGWSHVLVLGAVAGAWCPSCSFHLNVIARVRCGGRWLAICICATCYDSTNGPHSRSWPIPMTNHRRHQSPVAPSMCWFIWSHAPTHRGWSELPVISRCRTLLLAKTSFLFRRKVILWIVRRDSHPSLFGDLLSNVKNKSSVSAFFVYHLITAIWQGECLSGLQRRRSPQGDQMDELSIERAHE